MTTRAQTHTLKPKTFKTISCPITLDPNKEPTIYRQAHKYPCWQQAMQAECSALIRNNTWSLVPRPPNTNLVGCK